MMIFSNLFQQSKEPPKSHLFSRGHVIVYKKCCPGSNISLLTTMLFSSNILPPPLLSRRKTMYDHDYKLSKKRQLPTYAGYDIPAKVFTDLAFSFAHVRGKYLLGDLRTRLNASLVFNSLKQAPPHEGTCLSVSFYSHCPIQV